MVRHVPTTVGLIVVSFVLATRVAPALSQASAPEVTGEGGAPIYRCQDNKASFTSLATVDVTVQQAFMTNCDGRSLNIRFARVAETVPIVIQLRNIKFSQVRFGPNATETLRSGDFVEIVNSQATTDFRFINSGELVLDAGARLLFVNTNMRVTQLKVALSDPTANFTVVGGDLGEFTFVPRLTNASSVNFDGVSMLLGDFRGAVDDGSELTFYSCNVKWQMRLGFKGTFRVTNRSAVKIMDSNFSPGHAGSVYQQFLLLSNAVFISESCLNVSGSRFQSKDPIHALRFNKYENVFNDSSLVLWRNSVHLQTRRDMLTIRGTTFNNATIVATFVNNSQGSVNINPFDAENTVSTYIVDGVNPGRTHAGVLFYLALSPTWRNSTGGNHLYLSHTTTTTGMLHLWSTRGSARVSLLLDHVDTGGYQNDQSLRISGFTLDTMRLADSTPRHIHFRYLNSAGPSTRIDVLRCNTHTGMSTTRLRLRRGGTFNVENSSIVSGAYTTAFSNTDALSEFFGATFRIVRCDFGTRNRGIELVRMVFVNSTVELLHNTHYSESQALGWGDRTTSRDTLAVMNATAVSIENNTFLGRYDAGTFEMNGGLFRYQWPYSSTTPCKRGFNIDFRGSGPSAVDFGDGNFGPMASDNMHIRVYGSGLLSRELHFSNIQVGFFTLYLYGGSPPDRPLDITITTMRFTNFVERNGQFSTDFFRAYSNPVGRLIFSDTSCTACHMKYVQLLPGSLTRVSHIEAVRDVRMTSFTAFPTARVELVDVHSRSYFTTNSMTVWRVYHIADQRIPWAVRRLIRPAAGPDPWRTGAYASIITIANSTLEGRQPTIMRMFRDRESAVFLPPNRVVDNVLLPSPLKEEVERRINDVGLSAASREVQRFEVLATLPALVLCVEHNRVQPIKQGEAVSFSVGADLMNASLIRFANNRFNGFSTFSQFYAAGAGVLGLDVTQNTFLGGTADNRQASTRFFGVKRDVTIAGNVFGPGRPSMSSIMDTSQMKSSSVIRRAYCNFQWTLATNLTETSRIFFNRPGVNFSAAQTCDMELLFPTEAKRIQANWTRPPPLPLWACLQGRWPTSAGADDRNEISDGNNNASHGIRFERDTPPCFTLGPRCAGPPACVVYRHESIPSCIALATRTAELTPSRSSPVSSSRTVAPTASASHSATPRVRGGRTATRTQDLTEPPSTAPATPEPTTAPSESPANITGPPEPTHVVLRSSTVTADLDGADHGMTRTVSLTDVLDNAAAAADEPLSASAGALGSSATAAAALGAGAAVMAGSPAAADLQGLALVGMVDCSHDDTVDATAGRSANANDPPRVLVPVRLKLLDDYSDTANDALSNAVLVIGCLVVHALVVRATFRPDRGAVQPSPWHAGQSAARFKFPSLTIVVARLLAPGGSGARCHHPVDAVAVACCRCCRERHRVGVEPRAKAH